jgi:ABC-type xylose transport system permease subunit
LAIERRTAELDAIAELQIVAIGVIRGVENHVIDFIAAVVCAVDAIIEIRGCARLAAQSRTARLDAVAELTVVAESVIGGPSAACAGVTAVDSEPSSSQFPR